jgi:RNA polymerase sigma-70 factor (ECF subfamily)
MTAILAAAALDPETIGGMTDTIARLRRGDSDALMALISRHQHRLFRYLLRLSRDPAVADDLFQQTWLRVLEKIGRYDAARSFDVWLFAVAHNLAIDHFRGDRRMESLDAEPEDGARSGERLAAPQPDALATLLDAERSALLSSCMNGLPAIHREVLTLRFEEDMKLEEIAEVVQIPLSTVKSRLRRALEGLRSSVETRASGDDLYERT